MLPKNCTVVEISAVIQRQSDKAVLIHDGITKIWLPKSQIEIDGNTVRMPEWLAKAKGLYACS